MISRNFAALIGCSAMALAMMGFAETSPSRGIVVGQGGDAVYGDPVPGIDVSLEQIPGGRIVATTTTDTAGGYRFLNIAPGSYCVKTAPVSANAVRRSKNYNSSRSNVSHLTVSVGTNAQPVKSQDIAAAPAAVSNCFTVSGRAAQTVTGVVAISIKEEGAN